jgi:protease PrsW
MVYASPFAQPHPGAGAPIPAAPPAAPPAPLPPAPRRTGAALWWVGGLLVLLLLALVVYFVRFLGVGASIIGMVLAAVPFVGVWFAVRLVDRWEPEPRGLLLFGSGSDFLSAVVQAPIVEEAAKGLGIFLLFVAARRAFDGPVDGVVYGALVGAGFAFTENVQYFAVSLIEGGVAQVSSTFILRAVLSPFAHVMFTCVIGFAFGLAARRSLRAGAALGYGFVGFLVAVALHALWNGSAVLTGFFELYVTLQVPLFALFILGVVLLRREESRLTRARLGEYAAVGWFTPQEVDMLATGPGRRRGLAWARTLRGDRTPLMRTFIADATALAAARQRALSGRDPHAIDDERVLLQRTAAARASLFAP